MIRTTLRRRVAVMVSTVALSAGLVAVIAPNASAAVSVQVLSHSSYVDSGELNVVGEVRNDGTSTVELVLLSYELLDSTDVVLDSDSDYISLDRLAVGETSPFHFRAPAPSGYARARVTFVSAAETAVAPNHNFTATTSETTTPDFRHVIGQLRNDNTTDADFVRAVITFYNGNTVVNEAADGVDDDTTPAGMSSRFDVITSTVPIFTRYTIVGESGSAPSPAASPSPTPSPSASPSPTATPTASPTASPTGSPTGEIAPVVTVAPAVISAGQRFTATYTGTPNTTLQIWSKTQPATAYSQISSVTLDGSGRGTSSHAPTKNTRMSAKTAGGLESGQPLVQVRSVASINARRLTTRTYEFSGRVYPARTGRLVSLYRNGVLAAQGRTDASGIYRIPKAFPAATYSFFVRTGDDTYNLGTVSPTRRFAIS